MDHPGDEPGGAEIDVLLRSSATNYVVDGQAVTPLAIGGRAQSNAPDVHGQVRDLAERGVGIFVLEDDLAAYGQGDAARLTQGQVVKGGDPAGLISRSNAVRHWRGIRPDP